jgi:hypothetical protein
MNLKDSKINLNTTFYPVDLAIKNPYLDNVLSFKEFSNLINHDIINFNNNFFLDYNEILFEELNINEDILFKEYIIKNLLNNFFVSSSISYNIINKLFLKFEHLSDLDN